MNTETPETDNLFTPLWTKDKPPTDEELHEATKRFRKMERERDEARSYAERYMRALRNTGSNMSNERIPWENR